MKLEASGRALGARVSGIDLAQPLSAADFAALLEALGAHGVLHFPQQPIEPVALKRFAERFGALHVLRAARHFEPGMPEVTILSNIVEDGKAIGVPDAGQSWHTDMSYNRIVGFVNILVAYKVPMRNGQPLGATEFTNTQAAYADLSPDLTRRLANATAVHDIMKYREYLRAVKKSSRPLMSEEERNSQPPVSHPVFVTHPITGRKVIYVNPSFTVRIEGMSADESHRTLDALLEHAMQPQYRYVHRWSVGDVLMWDHIGTWHNATADYTADEPRLIKRCQVLADRVFDPEFMRSARAAARH